MKFAVFSLGIIAGSALWVVIGAATPAEAFERTFFALFAAGIYHFWARAWDALIAGAEAIRQMPR